MTAYLTFHSSKHGLVHTTTADNILERMFITTSLQFITIWSLCRSLWYFILTYTITFVFYQRFSSTKLASLTKLKAALLCIVTLSLIHSFVLLSDYLEICLCFGQQYVIEGPEQCHCFEIIFISTYLDFVWYV